MELINFYLESLKNVRKSTGIVFQNTMFNIKLNNEKIKISFQMHEESGRKNNSYLYKKHFYKNGIFSLK